MNEKISVSHLAKKAVVYVRQSSLKQVRNNQESTKRQRGLVRKLVDYGWNQDDVLCIEDLGISGTVSNSRPGYQQILEMLLNKELGLIISIEMSRLSRDQIEWQKIFRLCCSYDVLLADENNIYDLNNPNDRAMLGIISTISDFEMSTLRKRMNESWEAKASRGEIFPNATPGFVIVEGKRLKDPNKRVQDFFEILFREYKKSNSVHALVAKLSELKVEMPKSTGSIHRHVVRWGDVSYANVLRMLKDPCYAGVYSIGRSRCDKVVDADGEVRKKRKRVTNVDEWRHVIHNHHEAYITWEDFLENNKKIESKRRNSSQNPPVSRGCGLLAGLLHCADCGYKMHASYPRANRVRYTCHKGGAQRSRQTGCFSFTATILEEQLSEWVLQAVEPVAIKASLEVAQELEKYQQSLRQVHQNKLSELTYEVKKQARRYELCDPENRLVAAQIEKNWNAALEKEQLQREFIADFDKNSGKRECSSEEMNLLAQKLPQIWHHPSTSFEKKKKIVRTLVDSGVIALDREKGEIKASIRWKGGVHSECVFPWKKVVKKTNENKNNLVDIVTQLNHLLKDKALMQILNRVKITDYQGQHWTTESLRRFREKNAIPEYVEGEKEYVFQAEAAQILRINAMSVSKLIKQGVLAATQAYPGLPKLISRVDLNSESLKLAVSAINRGRNVPLYADSEEELPY